MPRTLRSAPDTRPRVKPSHPPNAANGRTILYITERAVFRLAQQQGTAGSTAGTGGPALELIEVAPGVDLGACACCLHFEGRFAGCPPRRPAYRVLASITRMAHHLPPCQMAAERDVLAHMDFRPLIRGVRPMPAAIFRE